MPTPWTVDPRTPVLLARAHAVCLPVGGAASAAPTPVLATFLRSLAELGFTATPALLERLQTHSAAQLGALRDQWVPVLRRMVGAHVEYTPMYPGFPQQVMDAPDAELYLNAIVHYVCGALGHRWLPGYEATPRPALTDTLTLRPLALLSDAQVITLVRQLIGANSSISAGDRADLSALIRLHPGDIAELLPEQIPHKEVLAFVAGELLTHPDARRALQGSLRTATDVLRLATALSDGDVSLAENTRFRRLTRAERRLLLGLLDQIAAPLEDMLRHGRRWIRLGERLHPGEYAARYPVAADAFRRLRAGERPATFAHQVEVALAAGDPLAALAVLRRRPGELARRLDHLLRLGAPPAEVLAAFEAGASRVSVPVLLQVMAHFRSRRDGPPTWRAFFPKGESSRLHPRRFDLPDLPEGAADAVVGACRAALLRRFAERPPLGRVYVDPDLAHAVVPFSQRSASRALRTLVRGSTVPLPAAEGADTVRLFLWWREGVVAGKATGDVDIDLSAVLYDDQWGYAEHISYTRLKGEGYRAAHSGDITSAPNGACEFIDLDLPSIVAFGGRYIVMSVLSFTGHLFNRLPECFAGWMMRSAPGSGEVFEPATVVDRLDLAAPSRVVIPLIIDAVDRVMYWVDLGLKAEPTYHINIEANQRSMSRMGHALTTLAKPTLLDLFALHAEARGTAVDRPEDADTVFSVAAGTPFDVARIMGELL